MTARPLGQIAMFGALLALLGVFVAYPLIRVLAVAVAGPDGPTLVHLGNFFRRALFLEATVNTFVAGAAAVLFGSLIALPLALLLARYDFPGRASSRRSRCCRSSSRRSWARWPSSRCSAAAGW